MGSPIDPQGDIIFREISTGIKAIGEEWIVAHGKFLIEYLDDNPEISYIHSKGLHSNIIRLKDILEIVRY